MGASCELRCAAGYVDSSMSSSMGSSMVAFECLVDSDVTASYQNGAIGGVAIQCVRPADVAGYTVSSEALDVPNFAVGVSCAAGYQGSAVASSCSSADTCYSLGGCVSFQCTRPADTTGYAIGAETLDAASFAVSVSCAAGYEGDAGAAVCSSAGDYTLSGCVSSAGQGMHGCHMDCTL